MQIFNQGPQAKEVNLTFENSYQIVSIGQQNVNELYVLIRSKCCKTCQLTVECVLQSSFAKIQNMQHQILTLT